MADLRLAPVLSYFFYYFSLFLFTETIIISSSYVVCISEGLGGVDSSDHKCSKLGLPPVFIAAIHTIHFHFVLVFNNQQLLLHQFRPFFGINFKD
ncbi:hypothetical protein QVD17_10997 [Tagetes erecta]|uniref:Uncharacterized protein n=1 Tax=Tagetes erecta TaxID=13708 RepID=A0AAD8L4E4_TARER|nr:hypothetical protein QVD17_10997 [Tagetes erecta]